MKKQRPTRHATRMDVALLSKKELELLEELGFRRRQSSERKRYLLSNKLRMRQLDQLKMMFSRMRFMENGLFPPRVKKGILQNDLDAYSEAVGILFGHAEREKRESPKGI